MALTMQFDKEKIKKILIMRSDGIGDFILSLPAMNALRRCYPNAFIAIFTSNWQEALAKASALFDKIIVWDGSGNYYLTSPTRFKYLSYRMLRHIPKLKSIGFDIGIDFKDDLRNRFIMWASGVKFRLGFDKWHSKEEVHKSILYSKLIESLVDSGFMEQYKFNIPEEDNQKTERFLLEEGVSKEDLIVVIHPVARWSAKAWPITKFAQLSDRLSSPPKVKVIFIGAKEEVYVIDKIINMMDKEAHCAAGKLTLLQTAGLIRRARLFVGNDAGPLHIAGFFNIPTVALFGSTDPKVSGPLGAKSIVIRKIQVRCPDCFRKDVGNCIYPDNFCMDKISVEEVFDICMKCLQDVNIGAK